MPIKRVDTVLIDEISGRSSNPVFEFGRQVGGKHWHASHQVPTRHWRMVPSAFNASYANLFGQAVQAYREAHGVLRDQSIVEMAGIIAEYAIGVHNEQVGTNNSPTGYEVRLRNIPAVIVMPETVESDGFWPLVSALRKRQSECSLYPVAIYLSSAGEEPRLLEEKAVTTTHL